MGPYIDYFASFREEKWIQGVQFIKKLMKFTNLS